MKVFGERDETGPELVKAERPVWNEREARVAAALEGQGELLMGPYSDDGTYGDYGYGIRRGGGLVPCDEGPTPGMPVWTLKRIEERLGL